MPDDTAAETFRRRQSPRDRRIANAASQRRRRRRQRTGDVLIGDFEAPLAFVRSAMRARLLAGPDPADIAKLAIRLLLDWAQRE